MTGGSAQVTIIGGGISGLATAYYLKTHGIRSSIVESTSRLGGLIQTDRVEGCDLEAGPDSFISTKPAVIELAGELGIADKLMGSNDKGRRIFVVRRGKLTPMPKGMVMMVPGDWSAALQTPLFSGRTKMAFLREWFQRPLKRAKDFSIRDLVVHHFGAESLDYVTEPLLSGVYGGQAATLSARSVLPRFVEYEERYGSLIKGVRQSKGQTTPGQSLFLSFAGGMQTLTDKLAGAITGTTDVVPGAATEAVQKGTKWQVKVDGEWLESSHVVLACAAHRSAQLLVGSKLELSQLLSAIPYSSSLLTTLLFEESQFDHALDGFGFLVPQPERRTVAAVTWINTKFPSRVAPGLVAIRAFLVDPEASLHLATSDAEITSLVLQDLERLMDVRCKPRYAKVYRWPLSMPQYVVGHQERCTKIAAALASSPGLHLTSNYLDGVGIPDCVRHAKSTAANIAKINNHS